MTLVVMPEELPDETILKSKSIMEEQIKKAVKQPTPEQLFKAEIKELISINLFRKKQDPCFPKLPNVFKPKYNKAGELIDYTLEELTLIGKKGKTTKNKNRAHTLSVIYGYKKRLRNYFKHNYDWRADVAIADQMLENPEDHGLV